MGYARKSQVSLQDTPYYHCVGRCVRRAWLWGIDQYSGKDYSHRKAWVIDRLSALSEVFAIDICAYAVMSNHYHVVVHVDAKQVITWTDTEVVRRWTTLFGQPDMVRRYLQGVTLQAESEAAKRIIELWRVRLKDVSWFMRCLNEHLARRANAEDDCTGRFWEGRFKCQALLDEAGLLTAMAYVDLNPVRAGIAATPESSEFTSIYERVRLWKGESSSAPKMQSFKAVGSTKIALPITFESYLEVLDWTGRVIREGKRGSIDTALPPIVVRLNIDGEAWIQAMQPLGNVFGRAMGKLNHLHLHAKTLGQNWIKGLQAAERLYRST